MSQDIVVFVLVGKWVCLDNGTWKFMMDIGRQGRAITISGDMSYDGLLRVIESALDVDRKKTTTHLSFWCPQTSNYCTQTRLPPVTLGCASEFRQFRNMVERNPGMNIFVTLTETMDGGESCENPPPNEDDAFNDDGDIQLEEGMVALMKSMEAAREAKRQTTAEDGASSSKRRGRVFEGRGMPTIETPTTEVTAADGDYNDSLDNNETMDSTPLSEPGTSIGIVPLSNQFVDPSDFEALMVDPPPHLDNLVEYRPDENIRELPASANALYVGKVFGSKGELQNALGLYAIEAQFCYKLKKSDKSRVIAVCVDDKCEWRLYAKRHKDSDQFEIRTATIEHTCSVAARARFGEKATSKVLAQVLQAKYTHGKKGPRASEIPNLVLSELKLDISYMKAWYAKEAAMEAARGKEEDGYNHLATYLHLLSETNPGTIYDLHTTTNAENVVQFKYLFVALGASIAGYQHLRKVVVIDGTQLKGKYKGCLVTASGQDGNMQIYPLAFGIVDSENVDSWGWFLDNLQTFVVDDKDLVIVSDRHAAITAALDIVYPEAHHASCIVHLYRNVKSRFKSSELAVLMTKAGRAYTVGEFRYYWAEIERRSPACAIYLSNHGFRRWVLSQSTANRYNIMTSNISESLNAALNKAVELPIVALIEFMREMLMRWFATRREKAARWNCVCTPEVEAILIAHLKEATTCSVYTASDSVYQVNDANGRVFTVDLDNKTCTCMVFNVLRLPCSHAIAATKVSGIDIYSLISAAYSSETWALMYKDVIAPVQRAEDNQSPERVPLVDVLPPKTRRPAGRPRTKRIPSRGEGLFRMFNCGPSAGKQCTRCLGTGHNRSTCKYPI